MSKMKIKTKRKVTQKEHNPMPKKFVKLKEPHFCQKSSFYELTKNKGDKILLTCLGCGERVLIKRDDFEKHCLRIYKASKITQSIKTIILESFDNACVGDHLILFSRNEEQENKGLGVYGDWIITKMDSDSITIFCKKINKTKIISKYSYSRTVLLNQSNQSRNNYTKEKVISTLKKGDIILLKDVIDENIGKRWQIENIEDQTISVVKNPLRATLNRLEFITRFVGRPKVNEKDHTDSKNNQKYIKVQTTTKEEIPRIKIKHQKYPSVANAFKKENLTFKLQLVNSSSNHVTYGHSIRDIVIDLPFTSHDSSQIQILSLKAHLCMDCNRIFDFHASFLQQLKQAGLSLEDVKIQYDINGEKFDYRIEGNPFAAFKPESFLHTLGYRVGNYGQSESVRHDLLYRIVQLKAMSISEIKNSLSQNIRLFSKREEYQVAVSDWKNDIQYMNSLIKEK